MRGKTSKSHHYTKVEDLDVSSKYTHNAG